MGLDSGKHFNARDQALADTKGWSSQEAIISSLRLQLWKKEYGELRTSEIREMIELRDEIRAQEARRGSKFGQGDVAGRVLKNVLKPAVQRRIASEVQERYRVSQRRVSSTLRFNRSSLQYRAKT